MGLGILGWVLRPKIKCALVDQAHNYSKPRTSGKAPLSGKPGGMAHVSQVELGCRDFGGRNSHFC
jgi:hypothetical protein